MCTFVACDAEETEGDASREAAAAAMLGGESVHSQAQKEDEERRKEAFAKRKAEEEAAEAKFKAELDAVVGLPEDMPKDLLAACDGQIAEWEEFVKKTNEDDPGAILKFYDNKGKVLGERKAKCMKIGSLEAAACGTHALAAAPPHFTDRGLDVLSACVQKYAPDAVEKSDIVAMPSE